MDRNKRKTDYIINLVTPFASHLVNRDDRENRSKSIQSESSRLTLCLVLLLTQSIPCFAASPEQNAISTIQSFLTAWQKHDANTMYRYLDNRSKSEVTIKQLSRFFLLDASQMSQHDRILVHLKPSDRLSRGAFNSYGNVIVHVESDSYATADCIFNGTFKSCWGTTYANWLPLMLRTAVNDREWAIEVLMAKDTDAPWTFNTLHGRFLAITAGQDAESLKGPFITMYLHTFTLIREDGKWKISNAITMSPFRPRILLNSN